MLLVNEGSISKENGNKLTKACYYRRVESRRYWLLNVHICSVFGYHFGPSRRYLHLSTQSEWIRGMSQKYLSAWKQILRMLLTMSNSFAIFIFTLYYSIFCNCRLRRKVKLGLVWRMIYKVIWKHFRVRVWKYHHNWKKTIITKSKNTKTFIYSEI